jgi:phospholipid/cholesterol/gamma-HCH transport system substrate-binding protein
METRARYLLIGLLALVAIAGGFIFIYWINTTGGLNQRTVYRVRFDAPAPGLYEGSAVLFNGLRVGEVTSILLDPNDPRRVMARITVDARTPVRTDTQVGLNFQGLTGTPAIALTGGSPDAPPVEGEGSEPPLLVANVAASQDTMQEARETLRHLDEILIDNAEPLKNAISNLSTFSDSLARNSDRIDKIAAGLEKTFGGGETAKPVPGNYGLTAPAIFPAIPRMPAGQLIVAQPTALILFDTQRLLVRTGNAIKPAFDDAKWSDNLPVLVQSAIVRSFENAGYHMATAAGDSIAPGPQLAIDIRDFTVVQGDTVQADVELGAKVLSDKGEILGAQTFRSSSPVSGADAAAAAAALDASFGKAATDLVVWSLGVVP